MLVDTFTYGVWHSVSFFDELEVSYLPGEAV